MIETVGASLNTSLVWCYGQIVWKWLNSTMEIAFPSYHLLQGTKSPYRKKWFLNDVLYIKHVWHCWRLVDLLILLTPAFIIITTMPNEASEGILPKLLRQFDSSDALDLHFHHTRWSTSALRGIFSLPGLFDCRVAPWLPRGWLAPLAISLKPWKRYGMRASV